MNKILITGGTGFIGRHCLPLLLERGDEVHATTSKVIEQNENWPTSVNWHQVDLLDSEQLLNLMELIRPTHLLHLAWVVTPGIYWESVDNFRWVASSLEILRLFAQNGGQRVVTAGSCAEYNWDYGLCREGLTPLEPKTTYGICKHALNILQEKLALNMGVSSAWGRIFSLYGPHEFSGRLVPSVISSLLKGETTNCTHGEQIRDLLHVEDVAAAFVALLHSDVTGAVNIASGRAVALKEVIGEIAQQVKRPDLVRLGAKPMSVEEPLRLVADVRRLQDEVKWLPRYNLVTGLEQTLRWWRDVIIQTSDEINV